MDSLGDGTKGWRSTKCWFAIAAIIIPFVLARTPAAIAGPLAERFSAHAQDTDRTVDHLAWTALLKRYVIQDDGGLNRVDYARFKREAHSDLKTYLASLESVSVSSLDRPEQFAFWVNLYNALTVDVVLERYPVESIRDIRSGGLFSRGPWKRKLTVVEGTKLSLDDIEHEILRPIWHDPRIHYAVNCASIGCPNLARMAYAGTRLDKMLKAAARAYINSPRGVRLGKDGLVISSIYKWYGNDFGGTEESILVHLRMFADAPLSSQLAAVNSITGYEYDWRLNNTQ